MVERHTGRNLQKPRPSIGLLIDEIEYEYQVGIWAGVADAARERDVDLVCFVGKPLRSPYGFDAQANVIYDLASAKSLDGLVIAGGVICARVGPEETRAFFGRYRSLPIVNIGQVVEGIPSVLVDNEAGLHALLVHLIEDHGCRRIAFIRGPEANQEAEQRYRTYAKVLAEHDIPLDPDLVTLGDFTKPSGTEATNQLLGRRKESPFEALVAANDNMALGALDALRAWGIRVPRDVILAGFDNIEETRLISPPLTTVWQPVHDQGRQATEMLLALLAGEEVPERVTLPTVMVIRQSCGCSSRAVSLAETGQVKKGEQGIDAALAAQRERVLSEIVQAAGVLSSGFAVERAERLLDAFSGELSGESSGSFLVTLDEIVGQVAAEGGNVDIWQEALSVLRRHALPHLGDESVHRAEDLWQQARVMVGEAAQRTQAYLRLQVERQATTLRNIGQQLITSVEVESLMEVVARGLPQLEIPGCYVSLYEAMSPEWSSLILAHDEERRTELETGGRVFPSGQLIPGGVSGGKRRRAVVVKSLYFRDNQLGFVVFEMGPREGTVYEVLRGQISSALHAARLVQQVESRALQLQTAAEVSRAASTILDPNELSRQVVNLIHERFDLYYAGLFLVDEVSIRGEPGSKWAVLRAGTGEAGQKMLEQGYRLEVGGESMIGWCIASKQTRVALDVGEEAIRFNNPLLPETRSELALPLVSRGEAIGALTIQSAKEAAFGEEDITILETLADQVANAIANIRLFERTQATLREMEAVHQRYLQQAWSEYLRSAGVTSYETGHPGVSPLGDALLPEVQQAMERRNALIVDGDGSGHSALVVPIALRGAIIGVLGIHDDEGGRRWTEDEISLVEEVVARMAQAAESIRLLDDTQHRVAREQVIGGVTAHLRETLDVDTVLQTAVREIRKALGLHDVTIQLGMDVDQAV